MDEIKPLAQRSHAIRNDASTQGSSLAVQGKKKKYEMRHLSRMPENLMRPQSIVLIASEVASRGGIQSFMRLILGALNALEHDSRVESYFLLSLNDASSGLSDLAGNAASVWGASRSKIKFLLKAFFSAQKTDTAIVGLVALAPVALAMKLVGRTRGYHVVLHGIEAWVKLGLIERISLRLADRIVVTTRYTAEQCSKENRIPLEKFFELPLCADVDQGLGRCDRKLLGDFAVLCVGRQDATERYKGMDHLLEAMVKIRRIDPRVHLNLVGDGSDHERLRRLAATFGVGDVVTFHGSLDQHSLARAFTDCDLFAMPSAKEGFGIVYLEAMRAGKPVLAAKACGTPFVVADGETGFLVDYGDVESMVERILMLRKDEALRHRMGHAAKLRYEQRFSIEAFRAGVAGLLGLAG